MTAANWSNRGEPIAGYIFFQKTVLKQLCGRTGYFYFFADEVINCNEPNPLSGTMNMTNRDKGFLTIAAQTILINFYLDVIGFSFRSYDDE